MPTPAQTNAYLDALAKASAPAGQKADWFHVSDRTPSMLGAGYDKDKHIIVVSQPEYAAGDDVTFRDPARGLILHRVTHTKPGYVFTKGTFNKNGDGWIPVDRVVGKVVRVLKRTELEEALASGKPPAPAPPQVAPQAAQPPAYADTPVAQ